MSNSSRVESLTPLKELDSITNAMEGKPMPQFSPFSMDSFPCGSARWTPASQLGNSQLTLLFQVAHTPIESFVYFQNLGILWHLLLSHFWQLAHREDVATESTHLGPAVVCSVQPGGWPLVGTPSPWRPDKFDPSRMTHFAIWFSWPWQILHVQPVTQTKTFWWQRSS